MNDAIIEVTGLRKRFGPTVALDGVTFTAPPGKVTGFIGPNGAGKSTTIRVILGLDAPDEGRARVGGHPYRDLRNPLRHVGALVDAAAVQPSRTARNHLLWLARSQTLEAGRVDAVLELVGLAAAARRKAGGFSLGMRQRLGIAAAMLGDPPVVILDEPFNGMDPEGIVWMRKLLRTLAAEGRALLVSSHLMSELQGIADHIVVIGRGKVLAEAGIDELLARAAGEQVLLQTPTPAEAYRVLHRAGGVTTIIDDGVLSVSGLAARQVVAALGQSGVVFSEVTTQRATLEDVYFQLTSGEAEFGTNTVQGAQR
ncbi:ABC transporter ATP-binding protein [Actinoallomurus iriomotensis]|uniref:Multidrug ABC transporter ATP-binding protein n=1 Tax=Actinoallomurus iriomotensis TaxID=478107 RepID=A0A9W6W3M3_9ACTN|nr:ATP-binding cassette domain-containing protein [Actinoallomurus iriomotensis]GLY89047.1 multidrug ABC transporter ATP-binding protein [Actinoallomurus iriomotensis]